VHLNINFCLENADAKCTIIFSAQSCTGDRLHQFRFYCRFNALSILRYIKSPHGTDERTDKQTNNQDAHCGLQDGRISHVRFNLTGTIIQ